MSQYFSIKYDGFYLPVDYMCCMIFVLLCLREVTKLFVLCPQLEKVLQQGDIGECAEPYMVFKESDAAKVGSG